MFHNQAYSQLHDGDMPSKQSATGDLKSIRRYVPKIKLHSTKLYGTVIISSQSPSNIPYTQRVAIVQHGTQARIYCIQKFWHIFITALLLTGNSI